MADRIRTAREGIKHALQVLEWSRVLELLAFECETEPGGQVASGLRPTFNADSVLDLQREAKDVFEVLAIGPVPSLAGVKDVRQSVAKATGGAQMSGEDLFVVGVCLETGRRVRNALEQRAIGVATLEDRLNSIPIAQSVEEQIFRCVESDGSVRDRASAKLGSIREKKRELSKRVRETADRLAMGESREYLSDPIVTVREGRYVLPVKAEHQAKVRGIIHDVSASGLTVYVEPEAVIKAANALRERVAAEREEEIRILAQLSKSVGCIGDKIESGISTMIDLDVLFAKARLALRHGAAPPRIESGNALLQLRDARHPLIESEVCVPLSVDIVAGRGIVITGPNTGGKTVCLKTVGLAIAMLQCGLFAFAKSAAFSPFSQIWADIGDEQSIQQSLSTFSAHLGNIVSAARLIEPGGLVLMDEVGAGTDPREGAALAQAVLRWFCRHGAAVLASTHFGELKLFAASESGFSNAGMEFDSKTMKPTYRLHVGVPGQSQALQIAKRLGMPDELLSDAFAFYGSDTQSIDVLQSELESAKRQARTAQSEADRRAAAAERGAQSKEARLDELEKALKRRYQSVIDEAELEMREMRTKLREIIDQGQRDGIAITRGAAREQLRDLERLGDSVQKRREAHSLASNEESVEFFVGQSVRLRRFGSTGVVVNPAGANSWWVQAGSIKMIVAASDLSPIEISSPVSSPTQHVNRSSSGTASAFAEELNIISMRSERAELEIERFLDTALAHGADRIRVVHGRGTGALRKLTQEVLKRSKNVAGFEAADSANGGDAVTVVRLK